MAPVNRLDAMCASLTYAPHQEPADDEAFDLSDFEAELKRLSSANQELMDQFQLPADSADAEPAPVDAPADEVAELRNANAELRARIEELEAAPPGQDDEI